MRLTPLLALIPAALLAGCAAAPKYEAPAVSYVCPNGAKFVTQLSTDGKTLKLLSDGTTLELKQVKAASGAKYEGEKTTFWEKGGDAMLMSANEIKAQSCRDVKKQETNMATLAGTVTYKVRSALSSQARVEVKLQDVSLADAPAVTLGEFKLDNPGQVPIPFAIQYDTRMLQQGHTYAVAASIYEGDKLRFISDTRNTVLADGTQKDPVEIWVVMVSQ